MFGWLATPVSRRLSHAARIATRRLPLSAQQLATSLPMLGSVLYLPRGGAASLPEPSVAGLLTDTLMLLPLVRTRYLHADSAVTVDGPREWIDCVDGHGYPLARIYLLPDTDYRAWDALLAQAAGSSPPAPGPLQPQPFLARGQVVGFIQRQLGGLILLSCVLPSRLSVLGTELAREIARAEAVRLAVPQ